MKRFVCGFVVGVLLAGCIGVFATSYVANVADFKVFVNGKEFVSDPPALEVEGRTYLPLRAMGDALGVPVNWNEDLQRAEVGAALVIKYYSDAPWLVDFMTLGDATIINDKKENDTHIISYAASEKLSLQYKQIMIDKGFALSEEGDGVQKYSKGNYSFAISVEPTYNMVVIGYSLNQDNEQPDVISNPVVTNNQKINSKEDLEMYLIENYSTFSTSIKKLKFTFKVLEPTLYNDAYDYWIMVEYDQDFNDIIISNKYSATERSKAKKELKEFAKRMAEDLIKKMPNKKLTGGYYYSYYTYPTIKEGLKVTRYCTWSNFDAYKMYDGNENVEVEGFEWIAWMDTEAF